MPTFSSGLRRWWVKRGRVAHHRHHAHALGAGGDHHVGLADADAVGRHLHRRQARGAEAVDGDAAHALGQAGQHRAMRATFRPCCASGNAQPQITSSMACGSSPGTCARRRRWMRRRQQVVGPGVAEEAAGGRPMGVRWRRRCRRLGTLFAHVACAAIDARSPDDDRTARELRDFVDRFRRRSRAPPTPSRRNWLSSAPACPSTASP